MTENLTAALTIELRKIAYRQSAKDGLVITFAVHPNDMPHDLASAPIGTRFMAALVEIGDDEQPTKKEQHPAVRNAGILCNDAEFQAFLCAQYPITWNSAMGTANERAAETLREICQIKSRRELATNPAAATAFQNALSRFDNWRQERIR